MEEAPRCTSLVPLAFPCFLHCLIVVETEGLLDYQGRAGDHFHCTVEPSPGHIRCRKKIRKTIRNVFENILAPLRPLKIFHRHFSTNSKSFSPPKICRSKSFFFSARLCRGSHANVMFFSVPNRRREGSKILSERQWASHTLHHVPGYVTQP